MQGSVNESGRFIAGTTRQRENALTMFLFHATTTKNIATLPIKGVVPRRLFENRNAAWRQAEDEARQEPGQLPIIIAIPLSRLLPDHLILDPLGYSRRIDVHSHEIFYV